MEEINKLYYLVEQITEKKGDKYYYYTLVKCKTCNNTKKIFKNDKRQLEYCKYCNLNKYKLSFEGFQNKNYKVLEFSHKKESRNSLFYKVECLKCKNISIMRKDAITDDKRCSCLFCKGNGKVPSKSAVLNTQRYYYITGAKCRNLEWTITDIEFEKLATSNCYYCNSEPVEAKYLARYNKTKENIKIQGIDRLNSKLGYNIENCVSCCKTCNQMKMSLTEEVFINQINKIYNFKIKSSTTIENAVLKTGSE